MCPLNCCSSNKTNIWFAILWYIKLNTYKLKCQMTNECKKYSSIFPHCEKIFLMTSWRFNMSNMFPQDLLINWKASQGVKHTRRHMTVIGLHMKLNTNWHKTLTALTYWQVPLSLKGTEVLEAFQLTLKLDLTAIISQLHLLNFDASL